MRLQRGIPQKNRIGAAPTAVMLLGVGLALAVGNAASETLAYDPIGRLIDASYDNGGSLHYTYDANGNVLSIVTSLAATGVEGEAAQLAFALGRATPNPGQGPRSIAFSIAARGHVSLHVFDVQGRLIETLYDRDLPPARYFARFDSNRWASGVYFYRLTSAGRVLTGRMVVLR